MAVHTAWLRLTLVVAVVAAIVTGALTYYDLCWTRVSGRPELLFVLQDASIAFLAVWTLYAFVRWVIIGYVVAGFRGKVGKGDGTGEG